VNGPLVSVIIPVYNGERFLGEAIESALAQDYTPLEVIVVDDGSTDGSRTIAHRYPAVRYVYQENAGVAAAKDAGLAIARGEFIGFLDHDDTWAPQKVSAQVRYLVDHPELGCVFSRHRIVLERGTPLPSWVNPAALNDDRFGIFAATMLVRRRVFEQIGPFNETLRVGEDTEWIVRAKESGVAMAVVEAPLLFRRVHEGNCSRFVELHHATLMSILRASVARRHRQALGGTDSAADPTADGWRNG
jgi:glycosyltransferase involved in cell wall biosynthesis